MYRIPFASKKLVKFAIRFRMNGKISFALMPYGLWWRKHRRLFHEYFHRNAVAKHKPIQRQEVQAFLRRLLDTPDDFFHHIRQSVSCLIFECARALINLHQVHLPPLL